MILTILAREPLHGYGVSQRLAALSRDEFQVNPGSLFPSLYRLEQDGKLKAEWRASDNNRKAKFYRLTAAGRQQLEQHRERWSRVALRDHQRAGGRMTLLHRLAAMLPVDLAARLGRGGPRRRAAGLRRDGGAAERMRDGVPPARRGARRSSS